MEKKNRKKPDLVIRNALLKDVMEVLELTKKVYPNMPPYSPDMIRGQINNYPEGQFVAVYEGKIVGYCATFRIAEEIALKPHRWSEITGGGFASRHDNKGDVLYGMEVCVDRDYRGLRLGQRFYNERKRLCKDHKLKGIVFAGRIPGLARRIKEVKSAENYVELVKQKKIRDQVISFQIRNGFEILGVLENYLPVDHASLGYGVHMYWKNPTTDESYWDHAKQEKRQRVKDNVRVAVIQYRQRKVEDFQVFAQYIEYFVDVVSDYQSDFVVFPELFTLQLLSLESKPLPPHKSIETLTQYTQRFKDFMHHLAVRYNINIIGGSHPTKNEKGEVQNISYVFLRDGSIHQQTKIHPTPNEEYWWNISGGSELSTIMTDCGPIGVLICYDAEFPELARHLVDQGAQIIFVPFCTDTRQSYLRVRYCAQARAVENQCYMALAGNVGNLPGVENMDIQYAQSSIFTPCDYPFARDGIAADTTPNVETVGIADLNLETLRIARNTGTVQNLKNRRFDLYSVKWNPPV